MDKGATQPTYPKQLKQFKSEPNNSKKYISNIQHFLTQFKTKPCQNKYEHDINLCFFHHEIDKRRNPYLDHTFLYYPSSEAPNRNIHGENIISSLCINDTQLIYHPLLFKTQPCINFYNCPHQILCPHQHSEDRKHFSYGQFFRFDIITHKTKLCPRKNKNFPKKDYHERKTCAYYHNDMDKRRPNFKNYSHEVCSIKKCENKNCLFSHNKIQQVYHPKRYKSKFCQTYHNKSIKCQYKEFCAFAHNQAQIKIKIIHLEARDHEFYLYKYKTVWCPDTQHHDRSTCVYAHNIQDYRRNPLEFKYQSQKCQNWNFDDELKSLEESGCKLGMSCGKSHGWMEHRYHPQVYKKSKQNQNQIFQIIEIKLNQKDKQNQASRISQLVEEKKKFENGKVHHNVGIPFFKKQHELSESSRKTKAITNNIESDDSCARSDHIKTVHQQKGNNIRKNKMFLFPEDNIWQSEDANNEFERKLNEQRARSESKFDQCETTYSHSLKQTVGNSQILRKLKNNNINGFKIKNLSKRQIDTFYFLNKNEREILSHKVKLYHLKCERNPIFYSIQLSRFFIRHKNQSILQKTRAKKVKEDQLLALKHKQIEQYNFLTKEEKRMLPVLIEDFKKYCNQNQFNQINQQIFQFVSPKSEMLQK